MNISPPIPSAPPPAVPPLVAPAEAHAAFQAGTVVPTSGVAPRYTQANLISLSRDYAYDMLLFAQRNPKSCPLLEVTEPGSWESALAPGADLRADLRAYCVWEHGRLVDSPQDVSDVWRGDLVTFLIGCSFSFETLLADAGVPLRRVEQGVNVPMYVTHRACSPAGRLRRWALQSWANPTSVTRWLLRRATWRCSGRIA
jgi:uncharacterized protein YcsI (UPF0317 family)